MKWTLKLVFEAVPDSPVEHDVGMIERAEKISPASVGLTRRCCTDRVEIGYSGRDY